MVWGEACWDVRWRDEGYYGLSWCSRSVVGGGRMRCSSRCNFVSSRLVLSCYRLSVRKRGGGLVFGGERGGEGAGVRRRGRRLS